MSRAARLSAALLPFALVTAFHVLAEPPSPPDRAPARWSIDTVIGFSTGGSADDLVRGMRASGYDGTLDGFPFSGVARYPVRDDAMLDRGSGWVAARCRLGGTRLHAGLGWGTTELGGVHGFNPAGLTFLDADVSLTTWAAMAWFEPVNGVRIGAGPALHRVRVDLSGSGRPSSGSVRKTNAGLVLEGAYTVPAVSRVFFMFLAQYRLTASVTIGSWESAPGVHGATATFRETSLRASHGAVLMGVGTRF